MEAVVPWKDLCALIAPFYPNRRLGWNGCFRIHFLQCWFNLSDLITEEDLYDMESGKETKKVNPTDERESSGRFRSSPSALAVSCFLRFPRTVPFL